jgi:uncharacterized protein YdaU (DUF1376 family)
MKIVDGGAGAPQGLPDVRRKELYMRFFLKRFAQLDASLTPVQFVAYQRVLMHYAQTRGRLPADDKSLGTISRLPLKRWVELRELLTTLGFAGAADGYWHDLDQDENIKSQLATSERQSERARKRYPKG